MEKINSYDEFWIFYLQEHANKTNRLLHFIGTSIGFVCLVSFALTLQWRWFFTAFLIGYLFAWLGHFVFEKNKPATFQYPFWSFISDWRMWFLMLTRRLKL